MEILARRESLGRRDTDLLFGIIDACYSGNTSDPPEQLIIPQFAELIPHETFIHARVDLRHHDLCRQVNIVVPGEPVARRRYLDGIADCSLIRRWMATREPVYCSDLDYAATPLGSGAAPCEPLLTRTDIVVHGIMEPGNVSASCYALVGLHTPWSARHAKLLQRIVPHLNAALARGAANQARSTVEKDPLTARELEVLHWVANGKSDVEIGTILSISVHTVHIHVRNIKRKLDAANRTHAVMRAVRSGLF
jgi:DNA-binding CsgD family transcriptional regulator